MRSLEKEIRSDLDILESLLGYGVFSDRQADRILEIVRSINHTAEAKFATA